MSQPVFALFTRSLREENRSRYTYLVRFGLVGLILLFLSTFGMASSWIGAPGLAAFTSIIYINLFCITVGGLSYFASAITEEKEEQTLPLLRMTNLNSVSILLGKSTSRMLGAVFLLIAQIPFTFLAVSLGGISMEQVLAAYVTLLVYTVLLSNVALLFSVISPRTAVAALLTAGTLFALYVGPYIYDGLIRMAVWQEVITSDSSVVLTMTAGMQWVKALSPFIWMKMILSTGFSDPVVGYQAMGSLGLSAVFFLLAWWRFEPSAMRTAGGEGMGVRARLFQPRQRKAGTRRAWRNALVWKDHHLFNGGVRMLVIQFVVLLICVAVMLWIFWKLSGNRFGREIDYDDWANLGGVISSIMFFIAYVSFGLQLSRIFRMEIRWQTFSSLCVLPFTVGQIFYRKIFAAFLGTLPPLILGLCGIALILPGVSVGEIGKDTLLIVFYTFPPALLLLYLIMMLSILMKRGGLPVALIGWYLFVMIGTGIGASNGVAAGMPLLSLVGCVMLHFGILRRLEKLAAAD